MCSIRVREREYLLTDEHIVGYGLVNEVYEINHAEEEEAEADEEPAAETPALPTKAPKRPKPLPADDKDDDMISRAI